MYIYIYIYIFKIMILYEDFLWGFSIISIALYFLQSLRKAISMASSLFLISSSSSSSPSPSPSSSCFNLHSVCQFVHKQVKAKDNNLWKENDSHPFAEKIRQENIRFEAYQKGLHDNYLQEKSGGEKLKKRPARLVVPEYSPNLEFGEKNKILENKEIEIRGKSFCLASKKGRREIMEDGYGVMTDILGDTKQAFFAVVDGHGGRAAADYVAENLGKNIVKALANVGKEDNCELEEAIRSGYLVTDREFLSQGVSSGACAASVLLKKGELHVANVGDCRVVMSRKGVAHTLTIDHRVGREDERLRIENSGGFVHCRNGIWRVQGSLAISRAIGDLHLKEWIISEPYIQSLPLTSDCEFLIIASDGLWDKVNEQEAVDEVVNCRNSVEGCKKLVHVSFSRGNLDDITVMVVDLHSFISNPS